MYSKIRRFERGRAHFAIEVVRSIVEEAECSSLNGGDPHIIGHVLLDPLDDLEVTIVHPVTTHAQIEPDRDEEDE